MGWLRGRFLELGCCKHTEQGIQSTRARPSDAWSAALQAQGPMTGRGRAIAEDNRSHT